MKIRSQSKENLRLEQNYTVTQLEFTAILFKTNRQQECDAYSGKNAWRVRAQTRGLLKVAAKELTRH